jgi:membrane protease YdiL (CAAX protease family)
VFLAWLGFHALGLKGAPAYLWLSTVTVAAVLVIGSARGWDRPALGLVWPPDPGVAFWLKTGAWMSAVIFGALLLAAAAARRGHDPFGMCPPVYAKHLVLWTVRSVVVHPVIEEVLFRFVLCGALAGRVPPWVNVVVSGVGFALPHAAAGLAAPDNLIGGFFLAWAFLRSGTLAVPIAMHALGNAALLALTESGALGALACGAG